MEMKSLALILILASTMLDLIDCMPTYWCPVGRYPDENGVCNLCYENCGADGCTGPGSHLGLGGCNSCWLGLEHHHHSVTCMSPFTTTCPEGYYRKRSRHNGQSMTMCKHCHPLCRTCSGPGISSCESCRLYRWDGICISVCPVGSVMRGVNHRRCVVAGGNYAGRSRAFYLLPYRDRYRHSP